MAINRILINREECEVRIAFLDDQNLAELHTEKFDDQTIVNNVYRGRVQDVVPGLQAAFIDVGLERNMFLHFMDIRPESLVLGADDQQAALRRASEQQLPGRIERKGRRPRQDPRAPQADSPVKRGDEIIVQVVKDEIGGKAPRVTTNLSLAGRYLVLLPFPSQEGGVSKKIAQGQDRHRLKKLLSQIRDDDHSFIIRTAGMEQPDEAILKDAESLERQWEQMLAQYKRLKGPGLVHNDRNLLSRLIRDAFPSSFDEVICDHRDDADEVRRQLQELMPHLADRVRVFENPMVNIFEHFGVERQIEAAMQRKVWLKSGGYLIIDENEALISIDVNTGRFVGKKDQEKTSLRTNLEACEAIADQIRLRDIGGIIVIDFIDMLSRSHQEKVSEELKRHLKRDRARTAVGRIGDFGLCVLTRKRQRMSLINQVFEECPYCKGTGWVQAADETFRRLKYQLLKHIEQEPRLSGLAISAHPHFIDAIQRRYRTFMERLQRDYHIEVLCRRDPDFHVEDFTVAPLRKPQHVVPRIGSRIDAVDTAAESRGYEPEHLLELQSGEMDEPLVPGLDYDEGFEPILPTIAEVAEQDDSEDTDPPSGEQQGGDGEPGARRKRRRESSAERRARRKQREREAGGQPQPQQGQRPLQQTSPVPPPSAPTADEFEDDDSEEDILDAASTQPGGESTPAPGDGTGRRRTRRGRRGGRNRRRNGDAREAEVNTPAAAPLAELEPLLPVTPEPPPQPRELPKLKLTLPKPATDPIGDVLAELERSLEELKSNPEALAAASAAQEREAAAARAARHKRRIVGVPGEEAEGDLPTVVDEEEEKEIAEVLDPAPEPHDEPTRRKPPIRRNKKKSPPASPAPAPAPAVETRLLEIPTPVEPSEESTPKKPVRRGARKAAEVPEPAKPTRRRKSDAAPAPKAAPATEPKAAAKSEGVRKPKAATKPAAPPAPKAEKKPSTPKAKTSNRKPKGEPKT
jgi:ribonuclease G